MKTMQVKDYYGTLGVARTATEAEIKKAYRKLAREHHPDVAGPDGEERFKEVAAAYEVLGNADKRAQYDRGVDPRASSGASGGAQGFGFEDIFQTFFGGGQQRRGPASRVQRGGDTLVHEEVTLEEAVFGVSRSFAVDLADACATCNGTCCAPGTSPRDVPPVQRNRLAAARCAIAARQRHDHVAVPNVRRFRHHDRLAVHRVLWPRPHALAPHDVRRHPRGRRDRHAHSHPAGGRRGHRWRAKGRRVRGDSAEGSQGL